MIRHRRNITKYKKNELDDLGPVVITNRKMQTEFIKVSNEIDSIVSNIDGRYNKEFIKLCFCFHKETVHEFIENYFKKLPEKKYNKLLELVDKVSDLIENNHEYSKQERFILLHQNVNKNLFLQSIKAELAKSIGLQYYSLNGEEIYSNLELIGNLNEE